MAEYGSGDQLRDREGREQQTDDDGGRAERLRVERQQRNDDPEPYEVHEDRDEQYE